MEKKIMLKRARSGAIPAILLIGMDQLTKSAAVRYLKGKNPFVIWRNVFELRYLENRGAAFGLFQNQRWIFLVLTFFVLIGLLYFYFKRIPAERRFYPLYLISVLIFAGAVGNMIDRAVHGYVVDFFYFVLIDFPIFNMADIYVTVGAFLFAVLSVFYYKEEDFNRIM